MILKILTTVMPWRIRRFLLQKWFGFEIDSTARIGMSWIFPKKLIMAANTRIDHFTVAVNLDLIQIDNNATIGRSNWITGFPTQTDASHFNHQLDRKAELILGASSAITKNHHLDCTNTIHIGKFSTIAGYDSQFLTHSINVIENIQDSAPIEIGDYTFVGTNCVVLGGAKLPSHSVLGAKSLLNKAFELEWKLYGGIPSKEISDIPKTAKYFSRTEGFVF
ncbi:acyltransferase [Confluentibacter sediminis]|uniref:acyltransferase n=1 Tax=Confluentibacter sediminis TaxID=2219045 RepID=UPI000DAB9195|nr:acyltransferase [Confluentibacter sediminis]